MAPPIEVSAPGERPVEPGNRASWLDPLGAWLALLVPLAVTLTRVSPAAQWRDDLAIVRGLGLVPVGTEGSLSSVLMQLAALLPVGGRHLRAALVSAIALSLASKLIYLLARRALNANGQTPRLTPVLALVAALSVVLGPTWQAEGTVAGGATLAAALGMIAILARPTAGSGLAGFRPRVGDARLWLAYGGLIALAASESHLTGLVIAGALVAQAVACGEIPSRRSLALTVAGFVTVFAISATPLLARPFAERAGPHLGFDPTSGGVSALDLAAERPDAIAAWLTDVGLISVVLAGLGALIGLYRARLRWVMAPLLALLAADLVFPATRAGILAPDPMTPLRLLAVATLGVTAALGLHSAVLFLRESNIPFARPAAHLLVAFSFTLVLMTSEQSSHLANRRQQHGADVWTDEALGRLPQNSVLLVRSPVVAWRLWAARVVRGERPDVTVVPMPLLNRGSVAFQLLKEEPKLAPLVRDVAVHGQPGEYALSSLADERPVFVELDPAWDPRLLEHLTPRPLWLSFAPTALGNSDRRGQLAEGRKAFQRVLAVARTPEYTDRGTLAVLQARAREQALTQAALGDHPGCQSLINDLLQIDAEDPFAVDLQKRLTARRRGRVDVAGLLR